MYNSKFKGDRLKNARLFRGMTLEDLSQKTNLSKQAISKYENGTIEPTPTSLFSLSKALSFPSEYFFVYSKYNVKSETAYFRSLISTSKKDRTAQSVRLEFIAQIYETLFEYLDFPELNLPDVNFSDSFTDDFNDTKAFEEFERIAQEVRSYWKLGNTPINDLRYILEENGIVVTCASLNADKIDAFSQRTIIDNNHVFFIVISKRNQSIARARFDMAHELAHILLHPWSEEIETISKEEFKQRERQANMLASALLLPKETFGSDVSKYPTSLDFYQHLKKKWNVSISAMIYRTRSLGIITANQYQYLMRQISKNGWKTVEPGDIPYTPKSTLLQGGVKLLFEENILNPQSFMAMLKLKGIILNADDIEDMLCLKNGTLAIKHTTKPTLFTLKNNT